ncbi:MAG: cytochrome P450 [Benjaminiella poitrasii]|nr:MAG: cytochrome P450 [Benjaminiella poitrasii]
MIIEIAKNKIIPLCHYYYTEYKDKLASKDVQLTRKQCVSLSAAAVVTFVAWKLYKRRLGLKSKSAVDPGLLPPHVKRSTIVPLVGNLLDLQKDPGKYLDDARDSLGPCFSLDLPGHGRAVVVTGALISEVMKSTKNFSFTMGIENLVPTVKVVELSYNHKYMPKPISPREKHPIVYPIKHNFKESQIDVFSKRIQLGFKTALKERLTIEKGQEQLVNVWDTFTYLISYISCLCFAGSKVGKDRELVTAMATFTQKIIKAGAFLTILPSWLGKLVVRHFLSVEHEMDLIMNLIVPELEKIRAGEYGDDYEPTFCTLALDLPKEDGSIRSVGDAAYYFNSIALASIHTTSHFASFALHELACRPDLVESLRHEIVAASLEADSSRTPENIGQLPLLDSFFREVLRCNVDYLGLHHLALQDTMLSSGHVIPKGSLVLCAMEQLHRTMSYYENDEDPQDAPLDEFDAYRFVGKDIKSTAVGLEYITFGLGAHACPGRFFAANEIKYVIVELIMRFNIRTRSGKRAKDNVVLGMTRFPPREPLVFEGRL